MNERKMPWSDEAERAAVGAMLMDAVRVVPFAQGNLRLPDEAFFSPTYRAVYAAAKALLAEGRPVDVLTVSDYFGSDLSQFGGMVGISAMLDGVPDAGHAEYYLDIVRSKWLLRRQVAVCREVEERCFAPDKSGDEVVDFGRKRFMDVVDSLVLERDKKNSELFDELMHDWMEARRRREAGESGIVGLPTPWRTVNDCIGGLLPGITIIAGRPGQGKTTVEDCISVGLAEQGIPVARVTLDMTRKRLLARAAVRKAGVSLPKLKSGYGGDADMAKMADAMMVLEKYPMYINDRDREVHGICSWARGMRMKHGIELLTIDYVQQVNVSAPGVRMFGENQELQYISEKFKALSNELGMPIIVLSQLNRGSDKDDRVPRLSDLRGSGSLEQDASVVILSYHDKELPDLGKIRPQWLSVAKNQDGEALDIPFRMAANYFRFDEVDPMDFEMWGR